MLPVLHIYFLHFSIRLMTPCDLCQLNPNSCEIVLETQRSQVQFLPLALVQLFLNSTAILSSYVFYEPLTLRHVDCNMLQGLAKAAEEYI